MPRLVPGRALSHSFKFLELDIDFGYHSSKKLLMLLAKDRLGIVFFPMRRPRAQAFHHYRVSRCPTSSPD
jgi:hypothetical protein